MALVFGIAAVVAAAQALWRRFTHENPTQALMSGRQVKLSTNLIIVLAQAVGYAAELLSGTRTSTPATSSTTTAVEGKFGQKAGEFAAAST
jgi:hypothetical protein